MSIFSETQEEEECPHCGEPVPEDYEWAVGTSEGTFCDHYCHEDYCQ